MPGDIVLLTRPEADSRRVAERLAGEGIATAIWPLTRIVHEPGPVKVPAGTDGLVFTSQNAVEAFVAASGRRDLTAWCVGARTAGAARAAGFADVRSADGDVSDLARLLRGGGAERLLYLRGRHVSADLGALLADSGIAFCERIVYDARESGDPPADLRTLLEDGRIGVIAIWSRRAARGLARQVARNPDWPAGTMRVIAISARAAEPLGKCGFAAIETAARPDGEAMLAGISAAVRQKNG